MTSQAGNIFAFKKQLLNMFNIKIQLNLDAYAWTSYVNCEVFEKILCNLTNDSFTLHTVYTAFEFNKIDLIIYQDVWLVSFVFRYSRNNSCCQKFKNQTITKTLVDESKRKYIVIFIEMKPSLNNLFF